MKNSLKILYSEAATSYGGQERYIHRLMRMMRDQGHTVELLCQPQSELSAYLQADGFTVHHAVMDKGTDFWRNLLSLRRLIKQQAYDVVNTHSRRGVTPDYVDVVFPAVDLPDPLPPQQLRHELGLSTNALLIGTVAVLRKEKGVKELIQATAPILLQYPNVYLVVIGGGVLQQQLEQVAQQLNVSNQVFFLGTRNDLLVLIADLDIFASATYLEASGTAFAEAAAAKLPVVGTEVGGVPEMMSPGKSGLLVPLHNLSALREALQRLIDDPDLRHQMGQAGNRILNTQKARKAVLITFDDGYLNNWVYAFPLLKKYGFKATIFLVTSWLHHGEVRANTDLSAELPFCPDHHVCEALIAADCSDQVILRWQEAQAMQDSGLIEFHSHTHTHTRWDKIEPQNKNIKMQWELDMSKQKLQKELDVVSSHLCWPQGYFDDDYIQLAQQAGFNHLYTTQAFGRNTSLTSPLRIHRFAVRNRSGKTLAKRIRASHHPFIAPIFNTFKIWRHRLKS